jgi:hypothetical protein
MFREGQSEPPAYDPADTPEGRPAAAYGMKFTAAIVLLTIIVVAAFVMR